MQARHVLKILLIMGNQGEIMAFAEGGSEDIRILYRLFSIP
jgi:hypothetical protein